MSFEEPENQVHDDTLRQKGRHSDDTIVNDHRDPDSDLSSRAPVVFASEEERSFASIARKPIDNRSASSLSQADWPAG